MSTPLSTSRAISCIAACICALILMFRSFASAEVVDRVVAEVNGDVITLSEVEEEGEGFLRKIALEVPSEDRMAAVQQVRQDILRSLIDKKLIEQEATKQGITVTDEEIQESFEQVLAANRVSREELLRQLKRNGVTEETYLSNLKSQIYQNKLVSRDVRSKVVITEEAILDYYDTHYTEQVKEGSYYLLQIGIGWGETEGQEIDPATLEKNKQAAREQAERVRQLALSGSDFKELARKFSDLPSADEGGDIGSFEENELASYMKYAVTSLTPGEVSDIVETPVGYQFFKLLSSKEGGIVLRVPYGDVKEEIREILYRQELEKEFESWIAGIRERAYIRTSL
ncbi:MAG: SurA N-terminal domain-containing protein [Desulfofustis sp.]|nr:SurA N-terminal domain-containing protein [Desulfofustis sp.]